MNSHKVRQMFEKRQTNSHLLYYIMGFPGGWGSKEYACQGRGHRRRAFDPWVGKIPWRRKWQPAPVRWPGKSHGPRSLATVHGVSKSQRLNDRACTP